MLELLENTRFYCQKMLECQENARIAIKCQNFQKMLEFQENVDRISRKGYNFFLGKPTISRKKMPEILENARISRKCQNC